MNSIVKILLLCIYAGSATSAADEFDELFSLSLQELVNFQITTVSKRKESINEAPGVVSVITSEDIQNYGATSLKDVLLRQPNFYIFDSATFKASGAMMRAGATQHLNNHVLYLINGRPIRESQNGGLHTDINLLFPLEIIERIEVIRGPGSVLYGSNAYSGTVNVITKENTEKLYGSVQSQNGSNAYGAHQASLGGQINKDINMQLTINTLSTDGETISAIDEQGDSGQQNFAPEGDNLFINVNAYDLSIMSFQSDIKVPAISGSYDWDNTATFQLKRHFYDIGYLKAFNKDWQLALNMTSNAQDRIVSGPNSGDAEFSTDGHLYEATLSGNLSTNTKIIAGLVQDIVKGNLKTRGGKYKTERQAVYTQIDHQLNDKTKLTAGLQVNKAEGSDSNYSPRLAMVYKYSHNWSVKLMHANAFRSPYGSELFFDSAFLLGDMDLKPETIQTNEIQLLFSDENISLNTTFYHSTADDLIGRAIVDGTNTFINESGEITYTGLELEWNWQLDNTLRIQGNASYQENEDESGTQDIMVAANEMLKVGLTYKAHGDLVLGFWNSYLGAANKLEDIPGNSTQVVNPESKGVNLLSMNISTNLGYLVDSKRLQDWSVSLYVNNILDEEVWYPELGRRLVNTFPQSHSQGIYGTISYSF